MYMLERLEHYNRKLREVQARIQYKYDIMDEEKHEDLFYKREEQIDMLDEMIDMLEDTISLVVEYNAQWSGLKSIK